MNRVTAAGIIISSMPIGEYDRRVEILTAEFGRISAFARGARKPGSPLVSVTRPFACGRFDLYQGKSSYSLNAAVISDYFNELTEDIELAYSGFYFLELAQYFTRENVEAADILKLVYVGIKALIRKKTPQALVKSVFELKMLHLNGLCPAVERLTSGAAAYSYASDMSPGCRKAYSFVTEASPEKVFSFILSDEVMSEFENTVTVLLSQNTDKKFKSVSFISELL
ncbi:MAG: DNA repair protein RecO [Parasporobacterium sp.]|nr:DNA repair protein RecO [Parasporobacterium sp.]